VAPKLYPRHSPWPLMPAGFAMLSGVLLFVSIHSLLLSLPPNCPRTRPKDAKTRPHGPRCDQRFLAFLGGGGGFEPPVPFARHKERRVPGTDLLPVTVPAGPALAKGRRYRTFRVAPGGEDRHRESNYSGEGKAVQSRPAQ
jgi:hypothetical protein